MSGRGPDWRSTYLSDPRLAALVGPGGPFEVEELVVDGVPIRDFVRAPKSVVDVLRASAVHESLVHVVHGDERWTFGDVRARALCLARELVERFGVQPGDRVAIAMRNLPEFVLAFWAVVAVGGIVVPLNAWWTTAELDHALADSGSVVVFADDVRSQRIVDGDYDGALVAVRATDGEPLGGVPIEELTAGAPLAEDSFALVRADDPVTILYTSGTTGRPRGAVNTHRGTIANLMNMGFVMMREAILSERPPAAPAQPGSIVVGPLFHIGGIASLVGSALSGSKLVLQERWDAAGVVALAETEDIDMLGGVPTVVRELLDFMETRSPRPAVRGLAIGGAPVPPELARRAVQLFGDSVQLFNGYGCTETTSAVVANVGAEFVQHPDSVGRPGLTTDLEVRDPRGHALASGSVGELCVRSPQNAKGYWNDPVASAETFVDGWVRTGDVGLVDDAGFVYVVDRLKDVVIRSGENVYCAEVEAVLVEHADIADAAMIGLADVRRGEIVCAVVVPRDGASVSLDGLRTFCAERLAAFKCPEALFVVEELPRTATGKTAKAVLRTTVAGAPDRVERAAR